MFYSKCNANLGDRNLFSDNVKSKCMLTWLITILKHLELIIINFIISHWTKVSKLLDCSLNEIPVDFFITNCNHMGKSLPCENFKIHFTSIFY
jgi:hypothetical protein